MLSAINWYGKVLAMDVNRDDGPFYCLACHDAVILKKGRKKIPHFAHQPDTTCDYSNAGESEEHRRAKLELYQTLLVTPGVTKLQLERFLGNVRPDVSFAFNGVSVSKRENSMLSFQISTR